MSAEVAGPRRQFSPSQLAVFERHQQQRRERRTVLLEHGDHAYAVVVGEPVPAELAELVRTAPILDRQTHERLPRAREQRVRDRLLGTFADAPEKPLPGLGRAASEAAKWLIPGLWRLGTQHTLGGNPKAGKTALALDLAAALLLPGRRFLDHFEVVPGLDPRHQIEHPDEWTGYRVWYINAETPADDLERQMQELGLELAGEALVVAHLEQLGGPQLFDLTDPARYAEWADRLVDCIDCAGNDEFSPTVVIVDGLTAILHAAGKGVESYGLWLAAFRRLMAEVEVPNSLVIAHNTMQGDHLMGGVEAQAGSDGLWTYSSSNGDRPASRRSLTVIPRLGGAAVEPTPVVLEGGRLKLRPELKREGGSGEKAERVDRLPELLDALRDHPGATRNDLGIALDLNEWQVRQLLGAAARQQSIREEACTKGCSRCSAPNPKRVHLFAVEEAP